MPVKSAKQMRFMYAAKEGKIKGVMPSMAEEMLDKTSHDTKSKFAKAYKKKK